MRLISASESSPGVISSTKSHLLYSTLWGGHRHRLVRSLLRWILPTTPGAGRHWPPVLPYCVGNITHHAVSPNLPPHPNISSRLPSGCVRSSHEPGSLTPASGSGFAIRPRINPASLLVSSLLIQLHVRRERCRYEGAI